MSNEISIDFVCQSWAMCTLKCTHYPPGYSQLSLLIDSKKIKEMELKKDKVYSRVVFYLKNADKELLINQCLLLKVKTSFYIRNCVLEKMEKPFVSSNVKDLELKKYTSELIRIGVNLNQISKKLNSGYKFIIADQRKVLNEIELLVNHILEIKSKL